MPAAYGATYVAAASSKPASVPGDIAYNGAYTQQISFKVPEQRGLEPSLGLSYDSARVNSYGPQSLVGAGWRLTGLSMIQRANGARRGVPSFDADDVWLLDGQELVPCGTYTGAGCHADAGGTHATWVESYQRIKQVTSNNTWELTARDGTRYVYKASGLYGAYDAGDAEETAQATQYRYLLAEKIDTLGQRVTFNYTCSQVLDCRISTISYSIGEVRFHWEGRPDPVTYAAGHMLGKSNSRLRSVEVRSAGQMLRTYELTYTQSLATGRSLLASVRERGRDSVVGSGGVVTAGTAMPAYSFQYSGKAPAPTRLADEGGFSYPDPTSQTVAISAGEFGADRGIHTATMYGSRTVSGGSDNNNIDDYCNIRRSDTGEIAKFQISTQGNPVGAGYCPAKNIEFVYFRNVRNAKKALLYKFEVDWHRSTDNNDYSGTARFGNYNSSPYGFPNIVGDFDGDGLDDGITRLSNRLNGQYKITKQYYSGSSAQSWANVPLWPGVRDLNGDGLSDLYTRSGSSLTVRHSNGVDAFETAFTQSVSPMNTVSTMGDFNGDGVADFLISTNGATEYRVYYTLSKGVVAGPLIQAPGTCNQSTCYQNKVPTAMAADLDGDGRDDVIFHRRIDSGNRAHYSRVFLNRGSGFVHLKGAGGSNDTLNGSFGYIKDKNLDGIVEVALRTDKQTVFGPQRYAFISEKPDLLTFVKQPLGAEAKIGYSHHAVEQDLDFPLSFSTVTSLESYDGRRVRSTTNYAYEGGRWDWEARRFLGFRKITATLPQVAGESGRPVIETTYRQDLPSIGRVETMIRKDGSGSVLQKREETYVTTTASKPYTSKNTETKVTTYYGSTARVTREVRGFDAYGLVGTRIQYGNSSVSGDEWVHRRWPYRNLAKYIVDRWAVEAVNEGTAYHYTNNRKWRRWHYFDGQSDVTAPPVQGLKTKTSEWTGGAAEDKVPQSVLTYDAYGNVFTEADGLGNTTSYVYDATYQLFPVEVRTPRYANDNRQKKLLTWDKVCGVVTSETDANGAVTSHSYDALCRKTRTDLPGGGQINHAYVNWGVPASSYNRMRTLHPSGTGEIFEETQFDGLGRVYDERMSGAVAGGSQATGRVHKAFDARGNLEHQSHPYSTGDTPKWVRYRYDGLDRQIKVTHPDGKFVTTNHIAGDVFSAVETVDELGNKRISHLDAYGNEVYRDRFDGATRHRTTYRYDVLNRLVGIIDPLGSSWSNSYDGHGNRTALFDPDLGCRQMTYDAGNRLTSERQANGALISYQYDQLGRTTQKVADKNALQFPNCAGRNDAPYLRSAPGTQTILEDGSWTYALPANTFGDPDGDTLTYSASLSDGAALPSWIAFDAGARTFTAIPAANYNGTTSLKVVASDGEASAEAVFDFTVTAVNDVPTLEVPLSDQVVLEDAAWAFTVPENTFQDLDGTSLAYSASLADGSALPVWLSFDGGSRSFSGTPTSNYNGVIDLMVTATDGLAIAQDSFTLTVKATNDAPVLASAIADMASDEDTAWSYSVPAGTFTDVDGDALTYSATLSDGSALPSWLAFADASRTLSGTPPANYHGALDLKVTASDGLETVSDVFRLTVTSVNDAPVVASAIPNRSVNEDTAWSYSFPVGTFSDVEGDRLTYSATLSNGSALPSWLGFTAASRAFAGTPPSNYNGSIDIKVTANDGAASVSDTFRLTVNPVNDAPVARNDSGYSVLSTGTVNIAASSLLANDSDVDGNTLSITSVHTASNGTVSLSSNKQTVTFDPVNSFVGNTTFKYTMSDGTISRTATVTVKVNAPTVTPTTKTLVGSGVFVVPFYNSITVHVDGGGGGGGNRGYYCCGSDNGWWHTGRSGSNGGSSTFLTMKGDGGQFGHGGSFVSAGSSTLPRRGGIGGASGGNVGNYPGGGSSGGAGQPTSGNAQGGAFGGNGGRATSRWTRNDPGAPQIGAQIPFQAGGGGSRNGQPGKVVITWQ